MAAMLLDLSFQDAEAEAEYRRARLAALLPAHARAIEWTRLLASLLFAARLALLRKSGGSIAAAALACLTTGIQLAVCGRAQLRCGLLVPACWGTPAGVRGCAGLAPPGPGGGCTVQRGCQLRRASRPGAPRDP